MKTHLWLLLGLVATTLAQGAPPDGKALYQRHCALCHDAAVGGAPKLSDKANWRVRFASGVGPMVVSAVKGKGTMPPRAGTQLSDADLESIVNYLAVATQ